jgi:uncharacterized protein
MAADAGWREAENALGMLYMHAVEGGAADGVFKDEQKALHHWKKAAENGHFEAQFNYGVMLQNGHGTPMDVVGSLVWFRRAATDGDHTSAQYAIGLVLAQGKGTPKDLGESKKWLQMAAAKVRGGLFPNCFEF